MNYNINIDTDSEMLESMTAEEKESFDMVLFLQDDDTQSHILH